MVVPKETIEGLSDGLDDNEVDKKSSRVDCLLFKYHVSNLGI